MLTQCPLTTEIMVDPVRAEDGITYEHANIVRWFNERGGVSPMVRTPNGGIKVMGTRLIPDDDRRAAIRRLLRESR